MLGFLGPPHSIRFKEATVSFHTGSLWPHQVLEASVKLPSFFFWELEEETGHPTFLQVIFLCLLKEGIFPHAVNCLSRRGEQRHTVDGTRIQGICGKNAASMGFEESRRTCNSGFLNLGTNDILGWVILCWGRGLCWAV